jgi:hypothetical protein
MMGGGCDAPAMVITPSCGKVACHAPGPGYGDYVTNPPSIIGRAAVFGVAGGPCMGMPLIKTTLPPAGVLFDRLAGDACGAGTRMPMAPEEPLAQDEIDCLKDWVTARLGGATLTQAADEAIDDTGATAP